jgi:hypothetical protein
MIAAAEELPHKRRRLSEDISGSRCASPADATSAQPASAMASGTQQQVQAPGQQAHAHQSMAGTSVAACQASSAEGQRRTSHAEGAPQASAQPPQALIELQAAPTAASPGALPQQNGFATAPAEGAAAEHACEPQPRSSCSDGSSGGGSAPVNGLAAAGKKRGGSAAGSDVPLAQQKPYLCTGFDCYVVQVLTL